MSAGAAQGPRSGDRPASRRHVAARQRRALVDAMKKNDMKYEYIEVAGGGHVDIAMQNMPKIFDFFEKHKKAPN